MSKRTTLACWRFAASLPVVILVAGCASLRTGDSRANDMEKRAQVEIEQRLNEVFAACERKDFDRLEGYHLYGPKLTRFSGSLPVRLDAVATQKLEHDGLASLDGLKMQAEGLKVDVFDNTGIATFILRYSFDSVGGTVNKAERTTLVFIKARGEWRIAHEHSSPIINAGDGTANGSQPIRSETNSTSSAAGSRADLCRWPFAPVTKRRIVLAALAPLEILAGVLLACLSPNKNKSSLSTLRGTVW
jgi:ketosteroid isomerase-like protein